MDKKNYQQLRKNLFYAFHTCNFLGISRRTLNNWLNEGKIASTKTPNGRHLFELKEINRLRIDYGMEELTEEEAKKIWETL